MQGQTIERRGALVEQVGGERGQTEAVDRIAGAPDRIEHAQAHHRQAAVLDRPDARPVGARVLGDGRELDAAGLADRRQAARCAHDATAVADPASACAPAPCGTTLRATCGVTTRRRAASRTSAAVSRV
jgi:hypothetical protein